MEHSTQFTPVSHKKRGWTRNAAGQSRSGSKFSTTYLHPGFRSETGQEGPTEQTVAVTTEKPWGLTGVLAAALANLAALQLGPRVVLVVLDQGEDRDRHGQPVSARPLSDARSLPIQYCMQLPCRAWALMLLTGVWCKQNADCWASRARDESFEKQAPIGLQPSRH